MKGTPGVSIIKRNIPSNENDVSNALVVGWGVFAGGGGGGDITNTYMFSYIVVYEAYQQNVTVRNTYFLIHLVWVFKID